MGQIKEFYIEKGINVCSELEHLVKDTDINFERTRIHKNNCELDALVFEINNKMVRPTLYLDDYLDDIFNENEGQIARRILNDAYIAFENIPDIPKELFDVEYIKQNLFVHLVNYESNKDYLNDVPHQKVHDLAIVPRVKVGEDGSFVVTNEMQKIIKMTDEEILEVGKRNTISGNQFTLKGMGSVIEDITGAELSEDIEQEMEIPLMVVLAKDNNFGATALIDEKFINGVGEYLKEDFYILPSSVHELLILPKSKAPEVEYLEEMVKTVNADMSLVKKEDFLSNTVYQFDTLTQKVTMATKQLIDVEGIERTQTRGVRL